MKSIDEANKRVALVTGASSGLGKAFANALLTEGLHVYAAARRVEQMAELANRGATPIKMDITREDDVEAAVESIESERRIWPVRCDGRYDHRGRTIPV
jgi:NADP-dependent 3-hydroxy acid dehydrogenase YdfG